MKMGSTHRFKVGVDFGTTFSGVAYIHTSKPDDVISITKWPGESGDPVKVPSEICYSANGEVHKWGYEIKDGDKKLAWFKLLLDPDRYSTIQSSLLQAMDLIQGSRTKKPVDVVADYLSCLRRHTIHTLQDTYSKAFVDTTPIDYTLAVPVIWSDTAKSLILQAAEAAGLGKIELMSEPGAAAWSLLRDIQPMFLKVHDAFVVVDCGGGTVDLASYEVVTVKPNFTVKERAPGKGVLCGSVFLNERFENLARSRIGKTFDKMKTRPRTRMLKDFEQSLKRKFTNLEEDDIYSCHVGGLPDNPTMGIEDGMLNLTREDMLSIFDPVIDQIIPLVQEYINMVEVQDEEESPISVVLLVGGFGASKYLLQRLEEEPTKGTNKSLPKILHTPNSWGAVARGAAHGIHIAGRKARRHYGTIFNDYFNFEKHPISNLAVCAVVGENLCTHCMRWYINYGDEVSENIPISLVFIRNVPVNADMIFTDDLYECEEITAPEYSKNLGTHDTTVRKLCAVVSDLSEIPKTQFRQISSPLGEPYYEVNYSLVMTIQSATLAFHLELNGQRYGDAKVRYLHDFNATNS